MLSAIAVSIFIGFVALMTVAQTSSSAEAETRTLRMYFTHTRESATITFKKNGRYLPKGLKKANRFLRDWRRKEPTRMDPALLDLVWEVYQRSGSRKPIHVISGYRSPKTNNMLRRRGRKVAKTSQHTRGKALDFFMPDVPVTKLRALGLKAHRGGVGYYRGSFVHLDTGRVRHWPRMSKRQLAKVFPKGRTIHVPSNGRPLRGYKTALANLKRGRNANGSNRKTKVSKTLFARLFTTKGNDGDEGEAPTPKRKPRVAPAKPVLVAKKVVKPKVPKGPDPFSLESTASARNLAEEKKAKEESLTTLALARVAVPAKRPNFEQPEVQLALLEKAPQQTLARQAIETQLQPAKATELALAVTTPETNQVLRPAASIPIPSDLSQTTRADVDDLKARIALALVKRNSQNAASRAVELQSQEATFAALRSVATPSLRRARQALVEKVARPADRAIAKADDAFSVPVPKPVDRKRLAVNDGIVRQASLRETAKGDLSNLRSLATPEWRARASDLTATVQPSPSSKPTTRPIISPKATSTQPIEIDNALRMTPELALGDLDGRTVKAWAIASSTRVGSSAVLRAPVYRQGTSRIAPASVYSGGFGNKRSPLSADRFTGRALTRVAFAHFGTYN